MPILGVSPLSGDSNIASLWRDHFDNLYNSVADDGSKAEFFARNNSRFNLADPCKINMQEISAAVFSQKRAKLQALIELPWKLLFMEILCFSCI